MISSREQAFIDQELEPDMPVSHEGGLACGRNPINGIGEQNRFWNSLTPEQQEKFIQNEREFKINREIQ